MSGSLSLRVPTRPPSSRFAVTTPPLDLTPDIAHLLDILACFERRRQRAAPRPGLGRRDTSAGGHSRMGRKKQHKDRMYRLVGEPGPGARVVGYVRYSSDQQSSATIETQKRKIEQLAAEKGWILVGWYEEPAHSAKYEEIERRPVFAQLLS